MLSLNPVLSQEDNADKDSTVKITMNDGTVRNGYVISEDDNEILFMDNKIGKIFITKANIKYQAENGGSGPTDVLTTTDGTVRVGYIISDDGREVLFMDNTIGKVFISKEKVKSIIPFSKSVESLGQTATAEFSGPEGPFTTRYVFATNALPIRKGENYAMINLYGPEVHISVTDRLTVGFMTTWIVSPFVLAAKYSIPTKNEKVNFGIGTMIGSSGYINSFRGWGGLHWGMVTFGDRLKNITISAGYSYINTGSNYGNGNNKPGTYPAITDQWGYTSYDYNIPTKNMITAPVIGFAGISRVGKKASLMFEAMVFIGNGRTTTTNTPEPGTGVYVNDPITGSSNWVPEVPKETVVTANGGSNVLAFIMPGIRFQSTTNRAFQVSVAAIWAGNDLVPVPIPQCSWFFQF